MDVAPPYLERSRRILERNRKRVARACDYCRRQKEKCDGGSPCKRCCRLRRQCIFSSPHQYGRHADGTAADPAPQVASRRGHSATASRDADERMVLLESIVKRYLGTADLSIETLKQAAISTEAQKTLSALADDGSYQPEQSVVEERYTIQPIGNNVTHYSGEFSHWNFSMRIKEWLTRSLPADHPRDSLNSFTDFYRSEELPSPFLASVSVSSLPPRSVANFLAHCFFKYAEANYFTIEKEWFENQLSIAYTDASTLGSTAASIVCIIFAVLAIGTQYAYLESSTEQSQGNATANFTEPASFTEDAIGVVFYHHATRLLSEVITLSSLESVQACLLLGIYALPIDASGLAYIYLNTGLRLGIQNGMHRKYNEKASNQFDDSIKNRVFIRRYFGLTQNRRIGIFHGRPLSLNDNEMDTEPPTDRLDAWPSASAAHAKFHSGAVKLVGMLSRVSHEISILKTSPGVQTHEALRRQDNERCEIHDWGKTLPEAALPKELSPHLPDFRSGLHLKLEYCLVRIFAGRCFIFTDLGGEKGSSSEHSSHSDILQALVADCIAAALLIMDTCRILDNTVGLARASYTEFSSCRAALLIITTQCLQTQTSTYRQTLREGLKMLKKMAHGSRSAHTEMSLIEGFERIIARLDDMEETSAYARFKEWENAWKGNLPVLELPLEPSNVTPSTAVSADPNMATVPFPASTGLPTPSSMPFFGTSTEFASFPQTLEDWSTFIDYGFSSNNGMNPI